jgi:hypothetical protein
MQPQNPNPDFDFMLKNNQAPKKRLPLPSLNLPKPAKIALAVVAGIFVLIIISSLLSGRSSGSTQAIINALARDQETLRVTALAQQLNLRDPQTQALAATVNSTLGSDKAQLAGYLAKNKTKISPVQLAADIDKTSDTSLQSASQNNGLDAAYVSYLKVSLTKYETDLQTAYNSAGPNGKTLLSNAFDSTKALLNSAPLKS